MFAHRDPIGGCDERSKSRGIRCHDEVAAHPAIIHGVWNIRLQEAVRRTSDVKFKDCRTNPCDLLRRILGESIFVDALVAEILLPGIFRPRMECQEKCDALNLGPRFSSESFERKLSDFVRLIICDRDIRSAMELLDVLDRSGVHCSLLIGKGLRFCRQAMRSSPDIENVARKENVRQESDAFRSSQLDEVLDMC